MNTEMIKPDMHVHAAGVHVGTVDHMEGNQWVKLKRNDSDDSRHHWFPLDWVESADDDGVHLKCSPEEFQENITDTPPPPAH